MTELSTPAASAPPPPSRSGRWFAPVALVLFATCAGTAYMAWSAQQRVKDLEQQLVKRQLESGAVAGEAQLLARQAQETSRDAAAKVALLDARLSETTLQRSQLDELILSLSRSRDENVLADIEAAIRIALLQSDITGSLEPMLIALKQSEERLARQNEPRLEGVRRALAQDLERVRAAGAVDIATLALRLDDAVRQVDDLPLLSAPRGRGAASARAVRPAASEASGAASAAAAAAAPVASGASGASGASAPASSWSSLLRGGWSAFGERVWSEVRGLVRVTPVDQPEAMLIAPEQGYFLRENLKLRLMNARLALLGRQFDTLQLDLRDAQSALERYFDRSSRRVQSVAELLRQVQAQARKVVVPRPDATLTAMAAIAGTR